MSEVKVTITVEVQMPDGAAWSVEESKKSDAGGNPLFIAEHVGHAVDDVAQHFAKAARDRFGDSRIPGLSDD